MARGGSNPLGRTDEPPAPVGFVRSSAESTSKNAVSPLEHIAIGLLVLGIAFVRATGRAPPLQDETRAGSLFDFNHDHAELRHADVLERVRWKRVGPEDVGHLRLALAFSSWSRLYFAAP